MADSLHLAQPLPLAQVLEGIIEPAYAHLLPGKFRSTEATLLLLAIGLQESRFQHRAQVKGPARGFWQFEAIGARGVLEHPATSVNAEAVTLLANLRNLVFFCGASNRDFANGLIRAFTLNDQLAAAFARLNLYTDPAPLPRVGDAEAAWAYYLRIWRPGDPKRSTWNGLYQRALEVIA